MTEQSTDELARVLWDYMLMGHVMEPCDLILVLGSNDTRVAEHGARLYLEGLAPRILFSGNVGVLTRHLFAKPEAEVFAEVAREMGPGARVVTILCDRADRYFSTALFGD